jgi:sugar phosphate isomerase/epimerase
MANRLAVQMYTLRDLVQDRGGFEAALEIIHGIGYAGVQLSAVKALDAEVSVEEARSLLDANGLKCVATHRPYEALRDRTEEEIAWHRALGCDYVAIGGRWGADYESPAGWRSFLAESAPFRARLAQAGIRFGYHNHAHEFQRNPETGRPLFDILIDADPNLQIELDTYWVVHAGADPANYLQKATGRVDVIHVKDREVIPEAGPVMAPVGEGLLDWDRILAAGDEAGVKWFVVEQDECRRDPYDCLASSFEFLAARGYAD